MSDKTTVAATPPALAAIPCPIDALNAAIEGARVASPLITGNDGALHALLPRGFTLSSLPEADKLPSRVRQRVTVDDRASLSAYTNRFSSDVSVIIADYDALTISARLDWHPDNQSVNYGYPGADLHSVTLKLRLSEEFDRWNKMQGKLHSQEDFARFLEENASDVAFPEAAQMIEISRDFEATVGQSYRSYTRLENGDKRVRFESESKAMNEVIIPQKFTLSIPIYNGELPDSLTALFRWRATPGGSVQMGFEWHRVEYQRRAHFQQIATTAAEETGLPVYIGRTA